MAEAAFQIAVDGQEVAIADFNLMGSVSGLADDRVFSEWLRLTPYDGTNVYKTLLPYGSLPIEGAGGSSAANTGTVQPTGSANGSILVFPFRAVVGSRTAVGANPLANWRDIRTSVFTGSSALSQTVAIAANASGNPRWDLIYAVLSVDVASGTQTRRVKSPSTGAVSVTTQTTQLLNIVQVSQVQGTPGSTPSIPALPSDGGGNYYIAIAAVRVPNGFNSSSTILTQDIRDQVKIAALQSPTTGVARIRPASGNNDQAGTYDFDTSGSNPGTWAAGTAGQRPPPFLPPGMVGGESIFIQVDLTVTAHPTHANGGVVDDTIDWRNRYTRCFGAAGKDAVTGLKFATDNTAGTGSHQRFPVAVGLPGAQQSSGSLTVTGNPADMQFSNTFGHDDAIVSGGATVWTYTGNGVAAGNNGMANGAIVGLYVEASTGLLKWFNNGTASTLRFFFWLDATAAFPNM